MEKATSSSLKLHFGKKIVSKESVPASLLELHSIITSEFPLLQEKTQGPQLAYGNENFERVPISTEQDYIQANAVCNEHLNGQLHIFIIEDLTDVTGGNEPLTGFSLEERIGRLEKISAIDGPSEFSAILQKGLESSSESEDEEEPDEEEERERREHAKRMHSMRMKLLRTQEQLKTRELALLNEESKEEKAIEQQSVYEKRLEAKRLKTEIREQRNAEKERRKEEKQRLREEARSRKEATRLEKSERLEKTRIEKQAKKESKEALKEEKSMH